METLKELGRLAWVTVLTWVADFHLWFYMPRRRLLMKRLESCQSKDGVKAILAEIVKIDQARASLMRLYSKLAGA